MSVSLATQSPAVTETIIPVDLNYVRGPFSIAAHNPNCKKKEHPCYYHKGIGNLLISDNKAYILTVAHLFTEKLEPYYLINEKASLPFTFANTEGKSKGPDVALIPLGEVDPKTNILNFKVSGAFHKTYHFHKG